MKKVHVVLLTLIMVMSLFGCGAIGENGLAGKQPEDVIEINEEISKVYFVETFPYYYTEKSQDLIDYYKKVVSNEIEEYCYVDVSNKNQYKKSLKNTDYVYFGKLKDNHPDGIGVVFKKLSGLNGTYFGVYDIADFEKGYVNDYGLCYRIEINYDGIIQMNFRSDYEGEYKKGSVEGEGITYWSGVVKKEEYPAMNNDLYSVTVGEIDILQGIPFKQNGVFYIGEHDEGVTGSGTVYLFSGKKAFVGELKNSFYVEGCQYYENGQLKYEGEYKNGTYHGKGVLYDEEGNVIHKGKFKKGDID